MPRVRALTYPARVADRRKVLAKKCKLRLAECGVKQKKIAKQLGISEAALSTQLSGSLSIETLMAIADMTDWTAEEIGKAIKN
jgi:predicted transcriptional regulator